MLKIQTDWIRLVDELHQTALSVSLKSDQIDDLGARLRRTELLLPVIGSFSAGKSSLLNAFLEKDVLPIGLAPETELATELRYGEDPHALAMRPDGTGERMEVDALKSIKARAREFTHVQLFLDDARLKAIEPLVLVDMPGFGSSLEAHNKAIGWYLPRGAHFIVVINVVDGTITQSLQRQLDDVHTMGRDMSVLLNQTNLRADDQVRSVAASIREQLQLYYGIDEAVMPVGTDGHEVLTQVLARIAPDRIVRRIFADEIKALTESLLEQIRISERALLNDKRTNDHALEELADGLGHIEQRRDCMIADLRRQQLESVVERALKTVEYELMDAENELLTAALAGNRDSFSRTFAEVVRHAVTRTLKEQMDEVSRAIVRDFGAALADLEPTMAQLGSGTDWLKNLTERLNQSLQRTGDMLAGWSDSLATHNARQLEARKQETGWKPGQPLPQVNYRNIATIVAVTTQVINPLIELAIIFLPEILVFIREGTQREQMRKTIRDEVIPSFKRELRGKLTALLAEQLDNMVQQVAADFAREIETQSAALQAHRDNAAASAEQTNATLALLAQAREHILRIAKEVQ
ncbi:hypothetical protein CBA19CS11_35610 [Caballeronia novacaledonica]|uniref:dynamin family protein n=1 Tax=Caballeronia novacaledonica TaxID=1544861 RepID=UPI001EE21810|nr:dynamin family protein [Caballeronia novacaledonica]GJH14282.1 hypothetical protein CBA19CS11_35610 [Caballeronia novacaledonica]